MTPLIAFSFCLFVITYFLFRPISPDSAVSIIKDEMLLIEPRIAIRKVSSIKVAVVREHVEYIHVFSDGLVFRGRVFGLSTFWALSLTRYIVFCNKKK